MKPDAFRAACIKKMASKIHENPNYARRFNDLPLGAKPKIAGTIQFLEKVFGKK